jgi:hypothetical protein
MSKLDDLIREKLPGQRFGVFYSTGEGYYFPNGVEAQSGFVVAEDGSHWSYWTDYELTAGCVVIEDWQPVFQHWEWPESAEYRAALAASRSAGQEGGEGQKDD